MTKYYYVIRTHSHTDKQQLWKVMSRRMLDKCEAETWLDVLKDMETNPRHEFFLVTKEE